MMGVPNNTMRFNIPSFFPSQFDSEMTGAGISTLTSETAAGSMLFANGSGTYNKYNKTFYQWGGRSLLSRAPDPSLTFGTELQPGIRIAATVQKVRHSAIVGLYTSKGYTAVTNADVQPDTGISISLDHCDNSRTRRKRSEDPIIVRSKHKPVRPSPDTYIP
jgi:hypothetical protein